MHTRIQRSAAPKTKKHAISAVPDATDENAILRLQRLIGNKATQNLLQRRGSVSVSATTDDMETASDDASVTQKALADKNAGTLESKFEHQADAPFAEAQHPGFAQIGIPPGKVRGAKSAVLIGNSEYQHMPALPGVRTDIEGAKVPIAKEQYATLVQENRTAAEIRNTYGEALKRAKAGDSVFLFYAGHGLPPGLLGVDAVSITESQKIDWDNLASDKRINKNVPMTGVAKYSDVIAELESAASRGVHVSLVIDACYSGNATDLLRRHAIEKIGANQNPSIQHVHSQIKRLEELKTLAANHPAPQSAATSTTATSETTQRGFTIEGEPSPVDPKQTLWQTQIQPELQTVCTYLAQEGFHINVPTTLPDYKAVTIEQQINRVINVLIDLAEKMQEDETKPVTPDVAPPA